MSYLDDFFDKRKAVRAAKAALTPEQAKMLEEKMVVEQRQKAINYKKFFGEEHGRAVMLDLMNKYHVLTPIDDPDPRLAAFKEGQRSVILDLLARANLSIEQLDKILKGEFV